MTCKEAVFQVTGEDSWYLSVVDALEFARLQDQLSERVAPAPVAEEWVEPRCILIRKNRGRRLRETDAVPFFSGAVALRAGAAAAIASEIVECGEMLGVRLPPGEKEQLVVFHVTKVIDALDVARSEAERLPDGYVMRFLRMSFVASRLAGASLFRLPQSTRHHMMIFCTARFVEKWRAARLSGLAFKEIGVAE
jgi:hypothetical protein